MILLIPSLDYSYCLKKKEVCGREKLQTFQTFTLTVGGKEEEKRTAT